MLGWQDFKDNIGTEQRWSLRNVVCTRVCVEIMRRSWYHQPRKKKSTVYPIGIK